MLCCRSTAAQLCRRIVMGAILIVLVGLAAVVCSCHASVLPTPLLPFRPHLDAPGRHLTQQTAKITTVPLQTVSRPDRSMFWPPAPVTPGLPRSIECHLAAAAPSTPRRPRAQRLSSSPCCLCTVARSLPPPQAEWPAHAGPRGLGWLHRPRTAYCRPPPCCVHASGRLRRRQNP